MQGTAGAGRLLITAFEPFGAPGKPKRPENASEEVLRAFGDRPSLRCDLVVLPVALRCEVVLARSLHRNPAGIVATGEAGSPGAWDTNVEAFARDLPVTAAPEGQEGVLRLESAFARGLPLLPGMEREDRIGSYWCNRAYFRVLQWCRFIRVPAVFLHFRVDGDRRRQLGHLEHVVAEMERVTAGTFLKA